MNESSNKEKKNPFVFLLVTISNKTNGLNSTNKANNKMGNKESWWYFPDNLPLLIHIKIHQKSLRSETYKKWVPLSANNLNNLNPYVKNMVKGKRRKEDIIME